MNSNVSHWLNVVSGLFLLACLLPGTAAAKSTPAKLSVEYVYALDGTLTGRVVNGQVQNFEYDKRGQLLAVRDARGNDLERYVYDPAGNILSKTIHGRTTRFTYDAANQIASRTDPDGNVIRYQYDAAGRLVREGNRTYHYGWQDKVEEIRENGKTVARFTYGLDGQLESVARVDGSVEHFYWDGLALIGRGKSTFLNEPYVTGGNPIASNGKAMLNDMLGSTVGIRDGEKMTPVAMTAFGETADPGAMYTGKPHVDGLGYAFLFRNYRAELGKWQTADPLGYPDGWNNLAYCNNGAVIFVDFLGMQKIVVLPQAEGGATLDNLETYIINFWQENQSEYQLVYAENINRAKQQLATLSNQEAIDELIFAGHGASSLQYIGSINNNPADTLGPLDVKNFYKDMRFSKDATILYEGCNTANSIGRKNLGQETADVTGCKTIAITGETVYSKNYYPFWIGVYYTRELGGQRTFIKQGE